jgi:hypothetical protein
LAATLTWLDHDADERDRMQRILSLFKEQDTRDELGVGVVRDLIADDLFPGTSTIQTRLRYMLFVPWIYQQLEAEGCPSARIAREARKREVTLVAGLLKSDDKVGVFGKRAGGQLERLPSSVYWSGLGAWGLRRLDASQDQYHELIDAVYRARAVRGRRARTAEARGEGDDAVGPLAGVTWHPKLPPPAAGFPGEASVRLCADEAEFLREQVASTQPRSLLARLMFLPAADDVGFAWEHPQLGRFEERHRTLLRHARLLADVMYGAALVYNLLLAEHARDQERVDEHRATGREWQAVIDAIAPNLAGWSLEWVPALAFDRRQVVSPTTLEFCRRWLDLVRATGGRLLDHAAARALVRTRELRLKGARSRFTNQRALDQWSGRAGLFRMSYRWPTVRQFLADLHDGVREGRS